MLEANGKIGPEAQLLRSVIWNLTVASCCWKRPLWVRAFSVIGVF